MKTGMDVLPELAPTLLIACRASSKPKLADSGVDCSNAAAHVVTHEAETLDPLPLTYAETRGRRPLDVGSVPFEEAVSELLRVGVVSDPDRARQLLKQYGDVAAVVAIIAG